MAAGTWLVPARVALAGANMSNEHKLVHRPIRRPGHCAWQFDAWHGVRIVNDANARGMIGIQRVAQILGRTRSKEE